MAQDNLKKIRLTVANKAAELIAEEGITDYHFAKTKAAKCLGFSAKEKLPSNNEIDEALKEWKKVLRLDPNNKLANKLIEQTIK